MLNAETARITRSADPQKSGPSTLREFVALFCTKRRNKRRMLAWEVLDWQGVKNCEKSVENYFGRILLWGMTQRGKAAIEEDFTTESH